MYWTQNAFAKVVWKLYSYARFVDDFKQKIVSVQNVVYHVMKAYHKEFVKGKQSFFQRLIQEDEHVSRHFVGVITGITSNEYKEHVVEISDGMYVLKTKLI